VLATERESGAREEDASASETTALAIDGDLEAAIEDEGDHPAARYFELGVVVGHVRRVVESSDRQVGRGVEDFVPIQDDPSVR
jgi:hypothetical protein